MKIKDVVELSIDSLSQGGGRGVGRHKGFVVFVPYAVPGDVLRVQITKVTKSFAEGRMQKVIQPSQNRVGPQCKVFGVCGGCAWQMASYTVQCQEKEGFVKEGLRRLGVDVEVLDPIVPSPKVFRYRNRIQLKSKKDKIGFFKKKTNEFVPIEDCLIAEEILIQKAKEVQGLKSFEVARTQNNKVVVRDFKRDPQGLLFSQVNESVNQKLKNFVQSVLPEKSYKVWDLYCGSGNFSFLLAAHFSEAQVIGVELSQKSVELAQKACKIDNLEFIAQKAETFLAEQSKGAEFVLLDPPRQGLESAVVEELLRLNIKKIVYISCNLQGALRDLKKLIGEYQITKVRPFDMFPHTDHLETVFVLEKGVK